MSRWHCAPWLWCWRGNRLETRRVLRAWPPCTAKCTKSDVGEGTRVLQTVKYVRVLKNLHPHKPIPTSTYLCIYYPWMTTRRCTFLCEGGFPTWRKRRVGGWCWPRWDLRPARPSRSQRGWWTAPRGDRAERRKGRQVAPARSSQPASHQILPDTATTSPTWSPRTEKPLLGRWRARAVPRWRSERSDSEKSYKISARFYFRRMKKSRACLTNRNDAAAPKVDIPKELNMYMYAVLIRSLINSGA